MRRIPWTETERRELDRIEADEGLDAFFHRKSRPVPGNPSLDPPPPPLRPLPAGTLAGMLKLCGDKCRSRNHSLISNLALHHAPAGSPDPAGERREPS